MRAKDGSGATVGELRPGHPCRAAIGPIELLIGGPPLVAQVGEVRWSGEDRGNGTTILRDGAPVARIVTSADQVVVYDMTGVALVKVTATGTHDAGGRQLQPISNGAAGISVGDAVVTGTTDPLVAGLLVTRELQPELRMLAACERVLR